MLFQEKVQPMSDLLEDMKISFLFQAFPDLSKRPTSLRFSKRGYWKVAASVVLGMGFTYLGIEQFLRIWGEGALSFADFSLGFLFSFAGLQFLAPGRNTLVHYELKLGNDDVVFFKEKAVLLKRWFFQRDMIWKVPLSDYQAVAFKRCPTTKIFSVNLVHPNPEKAFPIAARLSEAVARGQFEEFHRYLNLPKVNLVSGTSEAKEDAEQSQEKFGSVAIALIVFLPIMFMVGLVGWLNWTELEWVWRWLVGGLLGSCAVGLVLFLTSIYPYGVTMVQHIWHSKITELAVANRIRKRYRNRMAKVQELGFQELCCYREELPNCSAIWGFYQYCCMIIGGELTQIKPLFRLTVLLPLLALPGRSTYATMTAKGTSFFTLFTDGTIVGTSTHKKERPFNFIDQNENFQRISTGASLAETWRQHQERLERFQAEGKSENREANFEEFANIESRLYQVTLKNDWFT